MSDVWLETPRTVSTVVTTYSYTWFDCTKWVPESATGLILGAECSKGGAGTSVLEVRADPRLTGLKVFSIGSDLASVPRFTLNLDPRTMRKAFQHRVTGASFTTSLSLRLLGFTQ